MSELSVGDAVPVRRVADRGSVAIYRVILRCRGAVCRLWCRLGRYVAMVGWGYLCIARSLRVEDSSTRTRRCASSTRSS